MSHQSEEMGTNLSQIPDQMLESEGDNIHSCENDFDKENMGYNLMMSQIRLMFLMKASVLQK